MVWEIPCEVPYDRTYKIVVEVFGLLVGANYVINARRELILIEMSCPRGSVVSSMTSKRSEAKQVGSRRTYPEGKEL
jgi:hypothetical protein